MAEVHKLTAEPRSRSGTGGARATRRAGRVPGVIYGGATPSMLIAVDGRKLALETHKPGFFTTLYDLEVNGSTERVLAREIQLHPVTDEAVHIDFMRIRPDTRIRVAVPVRFVNEVESPGLKRGGVLNVVRHEVEVMCLADAIPGNITIDLTGLDIGDTVHISGIRLPEGVRPLIAERDFTIASIAAPTILVEEVKPAEAAAVPAEGEAVEALAEGAPAGGAPAEAKPEEKKGEEKKPEQRKGAAKKS